MNNCTNLTKLHKLQISHNSVFKPTVAIFIIYGINAEHLVKLELRIVALSYKANNEMKDMISP